MVRLKKPSESQFSELKRRIEKKLELETRIAEEEVERVSLRLGQTLTEQKRWVAEDARRAKLRAHESLVLRDEFKRMFDCLKEALGVSNEKLRSSRPTLAQLEHDAILSAMKASDGSTVQAAAMLGVSVRKIQYKLHEYGASSYEFQEPRDAPATKISGTSRRGFASMDPEKRREIARLGGRAAHANGTAHQFTSEEAAAAGSIGGRSPKASKEPSIPSEHHCAVCGETGHNRRTHTHAVALPEPGPGDLIPVDD